MPTDSPTDIHAPAAPLADWIEALLRDLRGQFMPRPVVLCELHSTRPEQVVMQVAEDALGRVTVLTASPLTDGIGYGLCDSAAPADRPLEVYVLDSTREGMRPEDAQAPCWINTLSSVRIAPPPLPTE
jgi:hypothetical protein